MKFHRRKFLQTGALSTVGLAVNACAQSPSDPSVPSVALDHFLEKKLFKSHLFSEPVIIQSLELLRYQDNFICRIGSQDGAEGISVSNNMQMLSLYPIFTRRLQPFFIGKDAREIETLLEDVYVHQSNYKLQSLALWVPLATIEFAILDLLGRIANLPLANLLGETHNKKIAVYQANNYRGKTAEESIEFIKKDVAESSAKALKFKVGGRMSKNQDYPPGRTEALIPLVRKTFGDDMVIYADSNGSYDVAEAVRIGKIMEIYKIDFYEEPVPFDWYEETKMVTDQLNVPIAGGEQEPSMHQFKWLIQNDGLDIVQPDMFYFGGMIRSLRVAQMAEAKGKLCVPHITGSGLGYLYMMQFVSILPNAGLYHEFKGFNKEIPFECSTSSLESIEGIIDLPTGPGLGIEIDPDFIIKHVQV